MANILTVVFGPPPVATPITGTTANPFGVPFQDRPENPLPAGDLAISWAAWFLALFNRVLGSPLWASATQSQLAALASTLTASNTGLRVEVTDFAHVLRWNGTGYEWAPEDDKRAGEITHFDVAPTGNGWKLVDGLGDDGSPIGASHPIVILKSDGTTRNNTTAAAQNAGVFLRGASAYAGGVTAATAPTSGTLTFTGSSSTTASGAANLGTASAAVNAVAAVGTNFALATHTHTDAGHTHGFTPSGVVSTPTITLPADPVAFSDALPYIRK